MGSGGAGEGSESEPSPLSVFISGFSINWTPEAVTSRILKGWGSDKIVTEFTPVTELIRRRGFIYIDK